VGRAHGARAPTPTTRGRPGGPGGVQGHAQRSDGRRRRDDGPRQPRGPV